VRQTYSLRIILCADTQQHRGSRELYSWRWFIDRKLGNRTNSSSRAVAPLRQACSRPFLVAPARRSTLWRSMTTPSAFLFPSYSPPWRRVPIWLTEMHRSGYDSYLPSAISQAQAAGKKLIIEEWGSLVGSGRTANLNSNVSHRTHNHRCVPKLTRCFAYRCRKLIVTRSRGCTGSRSATPTRTRARTTRCVFLFSTVKWR
jgi:hypothetical protein